MLKQALGRVGAPARDVEVQRGIEPGIVERVLLAAQVILRGAHQRAAQRIVARRPGDAIDRLRAALRPLGVFARIGAGARIEAQFLQQRSVELAAKRPPAAPRIGIDAACASPPVRVGDTAISASQSRLDISKR